MEEISIAIFQLQWLFKYVSRKNNNAYEKKYDNYGFPIYLKKMHCYNHVTG